MRVRAILFSAAAVFIAMGPPARAGNMDLWDLGLATSTGVTADWQDGAAADPTAITTGTIPSATPCCGDASGGTTPGLGNLSYVFNPGAAGTYSVSLYFDYDVAVPNYNEYGEIDNAGSAPAGIAGEIFNANTLSSNIVMYGACGTANCEVLGAANDSNNVPGQADNSLANCVGSTCNADVGMALTYSFALDANQYAVISADASTSDPGGFSIETIHPIDGNNASASQVYLTGSYVIDTQDAGAPEPSTWILMATALLGVLAVRRAARV